MAQAIFQIGRRDLSLPGGGLGRLLGGRSLPEELLGCRTGCDETPPNRQRIRKC